jgi:Kef-type K+ transport system membrane component KefB
MQLRLFGKKGMLAAKILYLLFAVAVTVGCASAALVFIAFAMDSGDTQSSLPVVVGVIFSLAVLIVLYLLYRLYRFLF